MCMKNFLLLIILGLSTVICLAHEPNEAYFVVKQTSTTVEVEAEFPWAIRKALLQYDKDLEDATTKEAFKKALYSYVSENLILFDILGGRLELLSIKELPRTGHSHGSRFLIVYQGKQFQRIKNELMFNLYDHQQNHHEVMIEGSRNRKYTTVKNRSAFKLAAKYNNPLIWILIGVALLIGVVILIVKKTT